jgi:hypothetical protein
MSHVDLDHIGYVPVTQAYVNRPPMARPARRVQSWRASRLEKYA